MILFIKERKVQSEKCKAREMYLIKFSDNNYPIDTVPSPRARRVVWGRAGPAHGAGGPARGPADGVEVNTVGRKTFWNYYRFEEVRWPDLFKSVVPREVVAGERAL